MVLPVVSYTIYHSANAYIGTTLLRRVMGVLYGTELVRRPIFIPRSMGESVTEMLGGRDSRNLESYERVDSERWAERYGIALKLQDTSVMQQWSRRWASSALEREELPARAFYATRPEARDDLDEALFEAACAQGLDVNEEDTIRWAARKAGLDADGLMKRLHQGEGAIEAWDALESFLSLKCPGVPTVTVGGECFFGKDRVDWIMKRCKELVTQPAPPAAETGEDGPAAAAEKS